MQAIILAEGKGSRLNPITQKIPKPLVRVGEYPILEHQIRFLKSFDITEIYISIYHIKEQIKAYFGNGSKWGVTINYYEPESPLGTAGAIKRLENKITDDFLVLYCDYLLHFDLSSMIRFHQSGPEDTIATTLVKRYYIPQECDHVVMNEEGHIIDFITRPLPPNTKILNRTNTGIYICKKKICNYIGEGVQSFEKNVFPAILKSEKTILGYLTNEYIHDMGSHQRLKKAIDDYAHGRHTLLDTNELIPEYVLT